MRVMAVAGFSFLAALLIAAFLGLNGGIALLCCAVVFAVASLILLNKQWGKRLAIVGLSAACACGVFLVATTLEIRKTSSLDEKTGVVTGEITNIVKRGSSTGYTLRTSKVDLPRAPQRLELVFYPYRTADLRLHDVIEVEMELSVRPRNAHLTETSGVRVLGLQSGEIKILAPEKHSFWYYLHKVKSRMQAGVNPYVDTEVEAITKGVVFGEDEGIDYTTQLVWSRAGISHLFSASGMHLAILSQTLMLLLGCLRVPKRASAGIVMGFVLLFMALLDFRMSILRAGIVSLCYYGGKLIRRDADSLNSMGLAAIIILLPNPFAIFDLSFLYSYFSSLGIILLAGRMERAIFERFGVKSKLWQWVFGCFCVSLSANLFILPLNLLFSDEFSVVGLLVNVLLAPYIQVMIPLGMFCYLIGAVPLFAWLTQAGCWLLSLIIRTVCDAAGWLIRLPYAYLPAGYGFLRIWLAASLLIAAAAWLLWRLRKAPEGESPVLRKRLGSQLTGLCAALCALVLLTGICADTFFASTLTDLTIVQGYQGASVVVSRGDCASVVCFGGDSYETEKLLRTLRSRGVRHIEAAVSAGEENSGAGDMTASYLRYIHAGTAVYDRSDLHNMPLDVICEKKAIPAFDLAGARITTQMTGHIAVDGEGRDRTITLSIGRNVIVIGADADTVQATAQAANAQIVILQKKNPGNIEKLSAKYVILLDKPSQSIYSGKEVVAGEAGQTLRLRLRANGRLKLETMD